MTIYIGQASCDENGRYVGGQAGNQSGTELNFRQGYRKPWGGLIRFRDGGMARACAANATAMVRNPAYGYDQGERNSFLPLAKAAGWDFAAVTKPCETDCSAMCGGCGIGAAPSIFDIIYSGGNLCYTGNIEARFKATGLVDCYGYDEANDLSFWQNGDILWSSSHAVVVTSGAREPSGSSGPSDSASVVPSSSIDEVARTVILGRYGNNPQRAELLAAQGYDAVAVQMRVNEMLAGTSNAAGTSNGKPRIIAGAYKVIVDSLNVRNSPSTANKPVASYSRGEIIYSVAADVVEAEGYVWAHYKAYSGATRYVAVGTSNGVEKYLAKI